MSAGAIHAETAAILGNLIARNDFDPEMLRAARAALSDHRKLSAVGQIRWARETNGVPSGLSMLAVKLVANPDLFAYRPALGLARQMLTGKRL